MRVRSILLTACVSLLWARPETPATADLDQAASRDVLLSCDFEEENWWRAFGEKALPQNTERVDGGVDGSGKGKCLRVTVRRDDHYGTSFGHKFRDWIGSEPEEIYFQYDLRFDRDWSNATSGGKLPGISGTYGRAGWGGRKVNGRDGWSARGLFETRNGRDNSAIGFYCYHADMRGQYGDNLIFTPRLEHGRWYRVVMHCKLNTPGRKDGVLRGWIDGKPAFERSDLRFRDVDSLKIEEVWINVYHGGEPVPKQDIHLDLDNIVISRLPIAQKADAVEKP